MAICDKYDIALVEDCAHTMGASWRGVKSGNFEKVAAFSTQTYKHMNSGEGGILTTNDPKSQPVLLCLQGLTCFMAVMGRSLMEIFQKVRLESPNYSGRMDHWRLLSFAHNCQILMRISGDGMFFMIIFISGFPRWMAWISQRVNKMSFMLGLQFNSARPS